MCKGKNQEKPTNKLTIVGGQPERKDLPAFNTNIEKVLLQAVEDENFRNSLLQDRKATLENPELSLTPQDIMLLSVISSEKMEDMIEKFRFQRNAKKKILKGAAITTALLYSSYLDFYCNRMKRLMFISLGMRPSIELEIAATVSKPLLSLYLSTMLFKIKQNFWKILITTLLLITLDFITNLTSYFLFFFHSSRHDFTYIVHFLLYHTFHIILFMIFSTIAIKLVFNIKWPQAVKVSITNSVFFLFIIPYLFRSIYDLYWYLYWYLFPTIREVLVRGLAKLASDPVAVIAIIAVITVGVDIVYRRRKSSIVSSDKD